MKPGANYIMLPLEPGDQIDVGKAGGVFPNGDETTNQDGWAAFSGTSAAAPQLAGVAALIKQACKKLKPKQIRAIMMKTARDVTTGNCNGTALTGAGGVTSVVGPDASTGNGLVDAHKAVLSAKVQCLGQVSPITVQPITVQPITGPIRPITVQPVQPVRPIRPIRPISPIVLPQPRGMAEEAAPEEERATLSEEDVASLQDLIASSDLEPDV